MGVDVASFGDYFREKRELERRASRSVQDPIVAGNIHEEGRGKEKEDTSATSLGVTPSQQYREIAVKKDASSPRKRHGPHIDGPIETLVYRDPFAGVYKK